MASTGTMEAELGSKQNPIEKADAPPPSAEEGDAKQMVPTAKMGDAVTGAITGGAVEIGKFNMQEVVNLVKELLDVQRKIGFGLKNFTPYTFESSGIFYNSGTSEAVIPYTVEPNYVFLWGARKSENTLRGAVGTFSYYIPNVQKTLHVMYSVPFDYNLYSNWWNATVVDGRQSPNEDVHYNLYNGKGGMPYPNAAGNWCRTTGNGFEVIGSMTTNGQATMELEIRKL